MTNRGTFFNKQARNKSNNYYTNRAPKEDDTYSLVCFKHSDTGHVGVLRIHQDIFCSPCRLMRGSLFLYCKHISDRKHRERVKKLSEKKRFTPTVYEQAIHLAAQNNLRYQSDKFHFRYKHSAEKFDPTSAQTKILALNNGSEPNKMEMNFNPSKSVLPNASEQRNTQVTLVFQNKTYTRTGTAVAQIRKELLQDMLWDRAAEVAELPFDIYYAKKNLVSYHPRSNIANSSVALPMAGERSQVMPKQQQEPLQKGSISSAAPSREDTGVKQTTDMIAHEVPTTGKVDLDAQPSVDDDVTNVCKDVLNGIVADVYSKCDEFEREREFFYGFARRRLKKRSIFYCDLCSAILTTEDSCTEHRNAPEHLEKLRRYQTDFLPWRRAIQESMITGKPMKEIMGADVYDAYKSTMALYLAPDAVQKHGRFCCAYCEVVFADQWLLEQHLHTVEHQAKQTLTNHKDLVPYFADEIILPDVYKFNGMQHLLEIPSEIRKEHQWSTATRQQLDEDTYAFLQKYPLDQLESATALTHSRELRKARFPRLTPSTLPPRVSNASAGRRRRRRDRSNPQGRGYFKRPADRRGKGGVVKRPFPVTSAPSKRFRSDLSYAHPGAHRGGGSTRNYEMNQSSYAPAAPFNHGNTRWPSAYPGNQQQHKQEHFLQPMLDSRSFPPNNSNNNRSYESRPAPMMSNANSYDDKWQPPYSNELNPGYGHQQRSYGSSPNQPSTNSMNGYRPQPLSPLLSRPPLRPSPPQRASVSSVNGFMHPNVSYHQRSPMPLPQQPPPRPPTNQVQYPNSNSSSTFGGHSNNPTNRPFFPPSGNPNTNQMRTNDTSTSSYADYRATSALPAANNPSSMYTPLPNTQNSLASQARQFNNFGRSTFAQAPATSFGRSNGPSFGMGESRFGAFGQSCGRGGFPPTDTMQPDSSFSYRRNSNSNNSSTGGQGGAYSARSFGSEY